MSTNNKPGAGFWVIGIIALLWNGWGVIAYLTQAFLTDDLKALMPEEQVELLEATPAWVTAAFAIAVFGGLLGSLLLLMRRKLATPLFLLSLIGVLAQMGYSFFATNSAEVYGTVQGIVIPVIVILFAVFLYFHSKKNAAKGVLR